MTASSSSRCCVKLRPVYLFWLFTTIALLAVVIDSANGQQRQQHQPRHRRDNRCVIVMKRAIDQNDDMGLLNLLRGNDNEGPQKNCADAINEILDNGSGQTLLMNAVLMGKSGKIITMLLDHGADVAIGEKDGYTPIHGAGFQGRAEIAKILVQHPRARMNVSDKHPRDGFTPLHRACWGREKRHTDTVRMMVELGADPLEPMCNPNKPKCQHPIEMARNNPATKKLLQKYKDLAENNKKKTEGEL